ncbi:MAG: glycoside hydrolase family 16 protein [Sphingopyxis sp.]
MARLLTLMLIALAGCAPMVPPAPIQHTAAVPADYALLWHDEFARDGAPDARYWAHDTAHNRSGWFNHELQYYDGGEGGNAIVAGGVLRLTARAEDLSARTDFGGQRYSSGKLVTRGRMTWTYGFMDVRAKMPCGAGTWPAIWMLGAHGEWPAGGEIDIMEQVGRNPGDVFGTVHNPATVSRALPSQSNHIAVPDACTAFHNYQAEWTPDSIRFLIDGREYGRYDRAGKGAGGWPYDRPNFMILNLAIGGDLGGSVDEAIFPAVFEVDYVRVYQRRW